MTASTETARAQNPEVARLAEEICLPFRARVWRGSAGTWQGWNEGSSVDFQDHRAYAPGDDPRRLDWAAYARTDLYTMKLFREEVSPRLDVALDVSRSMRVTAEKEARALDLFALVLRTALNDGISVRTFAVHPEGPWRALETLEALAQVHLPTLPEASKKSAAPLLAGLPWRLGSLRVLISDLLVPQSPEAVLGQLQREHGYSVILAPYLRNEAEPDWWGNLELRDCESRRIRQQRVDPLVLQRYRQSYDRHFEAWQLAARRHHVPLARVSCELGLNSAIRQEALPTRALVLRH